MRAVYRAGQARFRPGSWDRVGAPCETLSGLLRNGSEMPATVGDMKTFTTVSTLLAALVLTPALAVGGAAQPQTISYRTFHYTCDAGRKVDVSYVNYGKNGPRFAVLNYAGRTYGLAEALSASGARYASLYGPDVSSGGLEWWEAKGEGTLSRFVGSNTNNTAALLTGCKLRR